MPELTPETSDAAAAEKILGTATTNGFERLLGDRELRATESLKVRRLALKGGHGC